MGNQNVRVTIKPEGGYELSRNIPVAELCKTSFGQLTADFARGKRQDGDNENARSALSSGIGGMDTFYAISGAHKYQQVDPSEKISQSYIINESLLIEVIGSTGI